MIKKLKRLIEVIRGGLTGYISPEEFDKKYPDAGYAGFISPGAISSWRESGYRPPFLEKRQDIRQMLEKN